MSPSWEGRWIEPTSSSSGIQAAPDRDFPLQVDDPESRATHALCQDSPVAFLGVFLETEKGRGALSGKADRFVQCLRLSSKVFPIRRRDLREGEPSLLSLKQFPRGAEGRQVGV